MSQPARSGKLNEFFGNQDQLRRYHRKYLSFLEDLEKNSKVLDVGCGHGSFLELVRQLGLSAEGVDLSEEGVSECRRKGLSVTKDDAMHFLSDKKECYAAIYCSHLIEHFTHDDACRLLDLLHWELNPPSKC